MERKGERDLRLRVAQNVAQIRARKALTVAKLAQRAGLHWRHVQKVEAGATNATLQTIGRLAKGLKVDAAVLLRRVRKLR